MLEALSAQTSLSVIALDDIRLLDECPPDSERTFCDFESADLCGYQALPGNITWRLGSAAENQADSASVPNVDQ